MGSEVRGTERRLQIRLLGGVDATLDDDRLQLGPPLERVLLAALAIDAPAMVSVDELIVRLWGEAPPRSARKSVQKYVWSLRRQIGGDAVARRGPGYALAATPASVDLRRYEHELSEARAEREPGRRFTRIAEVLAAHPGRPLDGIDADFAVRERARLEEVRLSAIEDRLTTGLELNRHDEVIAEATDLARSHPYREQLWQALMLALYQTGRQADALQTFAELRRRLVEDLGIDPSPTIRELEARILDQDPSLLAGPPAPVRSPAGRRQVEEVRTVAVIAAADGPTDPDRDQPVETAEIARRWGGRQAGGGAGPLIVFGLPAHEDGLRRAASAALDLHRHGRRCALVAGEATVTEIEGRIDLDRAMVERAEAALSRATEAGPAVDWAAARLLAGEALLRPGAGDELILAAVHAPADRTLDGPFLGRDEEVAMLSDRWRSCARTGTRHVALVTGEGGIGKTRLLREVRATLGRRVGRWLQVTCRPDRDGPYAPIIRLFRAALGPDPEVELDHLIRTAGLGPREARWLTHHLLTLFEAAAPANPSTAAEAMRAWARAFDLALGPDGGVVAVDDAHAASPVLVGFLEELTTGGRGPLLIVLAARPELLDGPGLGPTVATSTVPVSGLDDATSRRLAGVLMGGEASSSLVVELSHRAGGNPLFLEELARSAGEAPLPAEPPTAIRPLIAARVDRAGPIARRVLQTMAVLGGPVGAEMLLGVSEESEAEVDAAIAELRRRQLVTASDAPLSAHRVAHPLVAEVVVAQVPDARRLDVHHRAAAWLRRHDDWHSLDVVEEAVVHSGEALRLAERLDHPDLVAIRERAAGLDIELGHRLESIDAERSHQALTRALAHLVPGELAWARASYLAGRAAADLARWDDSERHLRGAIDTFSARGERRLEALARISLANERRIRGAAREEGDVEAAIDLVRHDPGPELATALSWHVADVALAGRADRAVQLAEAYRDVVDRHGTADARSRFHHTVAFARLEEGDTSALAEMAEVLELCLDNGLTRQAVSVYNNLGNNTWFHVGPEPAIPILTEAVAFARDRGQAYVVEFVTSTLFDVLVDAGRWGRVLDEGAAFVVTDDERTWSQAADNVALAMGWIRLWRGDVAGAAELISAERIGRARSMGDLQDVVPALVGGAAVALATGDGRAARALIIEMGEVTDGQDRWRSAEIHTAVRVLTAVGDHRLAAELIPDRPVGVTRPELARLTAAALVAEATGDLDRAVVGHRAVLDGWRSFGHRLEVGLAAASVARVAPSSAGVDAESRAALEALGVDPGTMWWPGPGGGDDRRPVDPVG